MKHSGSKLLSSFQLHSSYSSTGSFSPGDKVQVEILSFGPLGASVDIIASSHEENAIIPEDAPALASGLILQKEIQYFRQARDNIDVVRGEILPAFVERVRDDGKVDVSLRAFGGQAKADDLKQHILDRLQELGGTLPIGDKSEPADIQQLFPGASKSSFKRAIANLYKAGIVQPEKYSVSLTTKGNKRKP